MNHLPPSLVRFERQLEAAIRDHPDLHDDDIESEPAGAAATSRRWPGLVVVAGAAAAVAVVALLSLPSSQSPASAVERAASVLTAADDTILHVVVADTVGDNSTARTESWQRLSPPYDRREIVPDGHGGVRAEFGWANGVLQQYDPRTNTITEISDAEAPTEADLGMSRLEFFRDQMLDLLRSGEAQASDVSSLDGRDVIHITAPERRMSMIVDAHTYEPVEWSIEERGQTISIRFEVYERLPVNDANLRLVSITASHPDASTSP